MQKNKTRQQLIAENAALRREVKKTTELQKKVENLEGVAELSQKWFKTFAESSFDGIVTIDEKGSRLYWNKAAEKITGYRKKEILGRNIFILASKNQKTLKEKGKSDLERIKEGHFSLREMHEVPWKVKNGAIISVSYTHLTLPTN